MVTIEEVAAYAEAFPDVTVGERYGHPTWFVDGKAFAWIRSFSKADIKRFGDAGPPGGPILAVKVEDLGDKQAVLESGSKGFFTIPHFDGFAAVLIQLDAAAKRGVRAAIEDAWLATAPDRLGEEYLANKTR